MLIPLDSLSEILISTYAWALHQSLRELGIGSPSRRGLQVPSFLITGLAFHAQDSGQIDLTMPGSLWRSKWKL